MELVIIVTAASKYDVFIIPLVITVFSLLIRMQDSMKAVLNNRKEMEDTMGYSFPGLDSRLSSSRPRLSNFSLETSRGKDSSLENSKPALFRTSDNVMEVYLVGF